MHRSIGALACAALFALSFQCAAGEIYRWVDAQGVVHYSDRAEQGVSAETVVLRPEPAPAAPPPEPAPTRSAPARPAKAPPPEPAELSIVMYVSPGCRYCAYARNHFQQRGVNWQEIDIDASAAAMRDFKAHGGKGTPLTYINGTRVAGWNPEGFDRVLAKLGYR